MLGRDVEVDAAGERDFHGAFAAVAVGVGASGTRGGGGSAVAYGDFALLQIFYAKGVAESAGQVFELENFARVGFFVDTVKGIDAALLKITIDSAIGGEHEFFDKAMSDVAHAAADADHALLIVEFDDLLGEIEVDGAVFVAALIQKQRQLFHVVEMSYEVA